MFLSRRLLWRATADLPFGRQAAAKLLSLGNINRAVHLPTYNRLIREEAVALRAEM